MKFCYSSFSRTKNFGAPNVSFTVGCVAVVLSVLGGCSPDVVHRNFTEPKRDFGPSRTDGELPLDEIKASSVPLASSIRWKGEIDTVAWNRTIDDLGWLSRKVSIPQIGKIAFSMRQAVVSSPNSWENTFPSTAYVSAAIGESREDTKKAIELGVVMLDAQPPILEKILLDRNQKHVWPTDPVSLVASVEHIDMFLNEFVREVERSSVDKAVKKQLVDELRINFGPRVRRIRSQFALAYNEKATYDFVAKIRKVLKDEGVALGAEVEQRLDLAERLPREVERIQDSKTALSVLVDFWLAASPETRIEKFKTLAPELYDFFQDQSASDLQCIRVGCGFITRIKRALFILPEIESYGVESLKKQLAEAADQSIRLELESEAVKFLPTLHKEILVQISEELSRQKDNISKISSDYGTYMRLVFGRVAVAKFGLKENDVVAGLETNRIRVNLDFSKSGSIEVKRLLNQDSFQTGAAAIGSGISAAIELHDFHVENELTAKSVGASRIRQTLSRIFFEQLNKVLMIGGFKTESSTAFDSLAIGIDGANRTTRKPTRMNLRTSLLSNESFAVPDVLSLSKPSRQDLILGSLPSKVISMSVAGQAEMLRGLSRIAMSLRDWEVTAFDRTLGSINLADFVPDLPRSAVDQQLFPKDLFFAAAIGNAGAILQNITKNYSAVGLIEPTRNMHWANESDPEKDPTKQAIMATMFDLVDGVRATNAKTYDVAHFLSALVDFLRVTDGIEKTRAEVLTAADKNGVRPIDQIISARQDLKLLVMAMANFLSSEAVGKNGIILPIFSRSSKGQALGMSGEPRLADQAAVIRALLDASEAISAGIYRTAALDLMSATNTAFFDPSLAFYSDYVKGNAQNRDGLSLEGIASILIAGERLSPWMSKTRSAQWTRASRPWHNALRDGAALLP